MTRTTARHLTQSLFAAVLACVLLRGLCVDIPGRRLIFFWVPLDLTQALLPAAATVGFVMAILVLSFLRGRVFCAWLCPFHVYLEWVNGSRRRRCVRLLLAVASVVLTWEVLLSFLWPVSRQIAFLRQPDTRWLALSITAGVVGFLGLLYGFYRERFCLSACPYGLVQQVVQGPVLTEIRFEDPGGRCIQCRRCDRVCPMNLDARNQSQSLACTACGCCIAACERALAPDPGLFRRIRNPMPEAS